MTEADAAHIHEEFGDLLFSLAQLGRFLKLNPEEALRNSTIKFQKRFERMKSAIVRNWGRSSP